MSHICKSIGLGQANPGRNVLLLVDFMHIKELCYPIIILWSLKQRRLSETKACMLRGIMATFNLMVDWLYWGLTPP